MAVPATSRPEGDGATPQAVPARPPGASAGADYQPPGTWRSITAQVSAGLGMVTGLWVALSPWFITLQHRGTNATITDLIAGLAVAAVGAAALASTRGFTGLQLGSLLLGAWLIISPVILDQKFPIAHPMYWSNSWSGGVLIVLALAGLAAAWRAARR